MADLEEFAARAQTVARQAEIDRAALAVVQALAAADIDSLVLKGPALARTLYAPREHRGYFDVDLLVSPTRRAAAGQVLSSLGYVDFIEASGQRVFPDDDHAELWTRRSGSGILPVELHWRLPGCEADPERAWEALMGHRAWLDIEGVPAPVLDRPGLALHLALHAAQHGPDDRKTTGDLVRGLDRWPLDVWRAAVLLADEIGANVTLAAGLRLLPRGAEVADQLRLPAAEAKLQAIAARKLQPRGTFHLRAFIEADSLRARASVLRGSLFPSRAWLSREHAWARGNRLQVGAAYAIHLVRSPGWALRAWRFRRQASRG